MKKLEQRRDRAGQALVEVALILPLLFLLIVNVVNFGGFFFAWITVANAARSGAQYMSMAGATVRSPQPATATQIYNVVSADISSLLNRSSLPIRVCTKHSVGAAVCAAPTGSASF